MGNELKQFPGGKVPLGNDDFPFECNSSVSCFTFCCKNVDMLLFPYDVIRLKNSLKIDSSDFLRSYTHLVTGDNPFFPSLKLKLSEEKNACPFLSEKGCNVYVDRPSACRTYPLERAVARDKLRGAVDEYYFLTKHDYCLGHGKNQMSNVKKWLRNQRILEYNAMNDLWVDMDSIFQKNPWRGEGAAGELQQLAFMVCYNIDGFRKFCDTEKLLEKFRLDKNIKKDIKRIDAELLKFGFLWLELVLTGHGNLVRK